MTETHPISLVFLSELLVLPHTTAVKDLHLSVKGFVVFLGQVFFGYPARSGIEPD